MNETKNGFRNEYAFLSNFWPLEMMFISRGIGYPTAEHFYQAMKFHDVEMRGAIANHSSNGLKAFVRKHKDKIRPDWKSQRTLFMSVILNYKFGECNPTLRQKLIDTGTTELVEYNLWKDTYWGVCANMQVGQNNLGKKLMEIRSRLMNDDIMMFMCGDKK
ncbi:MAG: NADAR family protein [Bacilli bacterium]